MDTETEQTELPRAAGQHPGKPSGLNEAQEAADAMSLAVLKDEAAVLHDRWMRAEAEVENVRTRAKRDIEAARQFAVQKFATDVVEAAENLRRGLDSIPKAAEPRFLTQLRDGFAGVEQNFLDLLKRNGVERENPTGTRFDSERHQAISELASAEHAPGTVLHAATSVWTLNGRLLRPAMVVVAKNDRATPAPQAGSHFIP